MMLVKMMAFPSRKMVSYTTKNCFEPLCPVNYDKILLKAPKFVLLDDNDAYRLQCKKLIHVTHINKDMETAVRTIGAGIAATGVIGPGVGVGIIFGNFLASAGRNPSLSNQLLGYSMLGAAFCEALGLFAVVISFMLLYS